MRRLSPQGVHHALKSVCSSKRCYWQAPASLRGLPIDVSGEVEHALRTDAPVVALESTLITHGMSPPHSYDLPLACEAILRQMQVTPATVAILDGRIKVGLSEVELARLSSLGAGRADNDSLWKIGRREIAAALVKGVNGGTTVSATMAIAHMAGIKIFSTGGIGGVHRGASETFDISSDLIALSDTPVAVVCAGSKSILDIGLTLEYLEAHGVPVAAYATDEWPAFYAPTSGYKAPMRLETALEAAQTIHMSDRLGLPSTLLLGVPLPQEYHSTGAEIQRAVDQAVAESIENGIAKSGKAVTPWLLARVGQLTKGKAVASNVALIKNNVRVGGEIAKEYNLLCKNLERSTASNARTSSTRRLPNRSSTEPARTHSAPVDETASVVVVGAVAIDVSMTPDAGLSPLATTAPGRVGLSLGGVGANIVRATRRLGLEDVKLVAPVGTDGFADVVTAGLARDGLRVDGLLTSLSDNAATATVGYLLDGRGELVGGVADFGIMDHIASASIISKLQSSQPKIVAFDGNISASTMVGILKECNELALTVFEPTSNQKAVRLLQAIEALPSGITQHPVSLMTPNTHELRILFDHIQSSDKPVFEFGSWFDDILVPGDLLSMRLPEWVVKEGIAQMAIRLLAVSRAVLVKCGSRGVVVVQRISGLERVKAWQATARDRRRGVVVAAGPGRMDEAVVVQHFEALAIAEEDIVSVTGAGDTLVGSLVASLASGDRLDDPLSLEKAVNRAQRAAVATLKSKEAVGDIGHLLEA